MSVKDLPNYQEVLDSVNTVIKEKLFFSDYTQLPDSPYTVEQKQDWATYRQALRDLSKDSDYPFVALPTSPQV